MVKFVGGYVSHFTIYHFSTNPQVQKMLYNNLGLVQMCQEH